MVEDYLSDREQEEALRRWWNENWRWLVAGVVIGLGALGGWQYWQQRAVTRNEAAAQAYRDMAAALSRGDRSAAEGALRTLDDSHGGSPYTDQAHLLAAQNYVAAGRFEEAASELKIVRDRGSDDELQRIANLRWARVQIQLGHYDEALAALDVNRAGAYEAQIYEIRGDALLAKGDASGARQAYQTALNAGQNAQVDIEMLRLKLADLPAPDAAKVTASTPHP